MEESQQEKRIVTGIRGDGTPYFELSESITPHEAIGLVRWLQLAIESNVERQQMMGAGGALEAIKTVLGEMKMIQSSIVSSHEKVFEALRLTTEGIRSIISIFVKVKEEETKGE